MTPRKAAVHVLFSSLTISFIGPRVRRTHVALLLAAIVVVSCTPVGGNRSGTTAPESGEPPIRVGTSSAMVDSTAATLLAQAESAHAAGRMDEAGRLAEDVIQQYPTASGSSRALLLAAQAAVATASYDRALAAADQYAALFPIDDPRAAEAALVGAEALNAMEQGETAARRLLVVPLETVPTIQEPGLVLMRDVADGLGNDRLGALIDEGAFGPLAGPILAERAMALHFRGEREAARALAIEIQALAELIADLPHGIEVQRIAWQSDEVSASVNGFLVNLAQAVAIVLAVLTIPMGWRMGVIIGSGLLLTILGTFMLMAIFGIDLQRMSLGALVIALGMMVDNAIVVADGFAVRLQRGMDRRQAAVESAAGPAWPLLGATFVAVMAFYPVFASPADAGEYCRTLFSVVGMSLMLSWLLASP